jgi:hypothetical protein
VSVSRPSSMNLADVTQLKGTATREDHKDDREGYELVLQDESARGSPGASAVGA